MTRRLAAALLFAAPIMAAAQTPPAGELRAFYGAAIASVEAVTAPELQAVKTACLTHLRENAARTAAAG
jgi:hypothetical protein